MIGIQANQPHSGDIPAAMLVKSRLVQVSAAVVSMARTWSRSPRWRVGLVYKAGTDAQTGTDPDPTRANGDRPAHSWVPAPDGQCSVGYNTRALSDVGTADFLNSWYRSGVPPRAG